MVWSSIVPLKRGDVEAALERKGFKRRESDHSQFIYYTERGLKTGVRTKTSHGRSGADIRDDILSRMAKQCRLSNQQFRDFVDCRLSRRDYEDVLAASDVLQQRDLARPSG